MNLLFLTNVFPFPPHHGSSVISYNWIRYLAGRHNIVLLSFDRRVDEKGRQELLEMGISLLDAPLQTRTGLSLPWRVLGRTPLALARIPVGRIRKLLIEEGQARKADAAILIGPDLAAFLVDGAWSVPVIFAPYDAVSLNLAMRLPFVQDPFRRAWLRLEQKKWEFLEGHIYPNADACVFVTDRDANVILRHLKTPAKARICVVPNGVDSVYFSPQNVKERTNHMVMTGNMGAHQSVVSIRWFLDQVLPEVQRAVPDATLDIVGRAPHPSIRRAAAKLPEVRITGYVPDVRPYVAKASLYVCCLIAGSGLKNRVMEAMAMGKAVVGTRHCCHGLQVKLNQDIVVAPSEHELAPTIIRLLNDQVRRQQLGCSARRAVIKGHSWEVAVSRVESLLQQIVQERGTHS
ncbi:glycosyltransferase [Acidobacteria bacterium AH-259-L09]|nr:glycosyltransferase [Acidobacteria bacterium AH-259-L09]